MVLRGAQFQRFGSVGWVFLTRRALFSYRVTFMQRRGDADCLPHPSRMTHRHLMPLHGGDQCWQPHKGLAPHGAREGDLCHGHIGGSLLGLQPW